jgi:hypothetical protein
MASSYFSGGDYPDFSGSFKGNPGDWSKGNAFGSNHDSYDYGVNPQSTTKPKWEGLARFAGEKLSKYAETGSTGGADKDPFGGGNYGGATKLTDSLTAYMPPQFAPFVIPGANEKSTGQRVAGGLGGAAQGALAGAPLGPLGMVAGGLIGAASGAFA